MLLRMPSMAACLCLLGCWVGTLWLAPTAATAQVVWPGDTSTSPPVGEIPTSDDSDLNEDPSSDEAPVADDETQSCDEFFSQPFPFLRLLIQLLMQWLEMLQEPAGGDDGGSDTPPVNTPPFTDPPATDVPPDGGTIGAIESFGIPMRSR